MTSLPSGDTEVGATLPLSALARMEGGSLASAGAETTDAPLDGE
jgi:hypothetical protein